MSFRVPVVVASLVLTACSTCGALDSKMGKIKPGMTTDQVKMLVGQPIQIENSGTTGPQGEAYLYPTPSGEVRVVFSANAVVKIEILSGVNS